MEIREVLKNNFVFEYGDVGSHLYIVLSGKVEIQIPDSQQKKEFDQVIIDIE